MNQLIDFQETYNVIAGYHNVLLSNFLPSGHVPFRDASVPSCKILGVSMEIVEMLESCAPFVIVMLLQNVKAKA
jgi:hypothetical protein